MSQPNDPTGQNSPYSLFDTEERVIDQAGGMIVKLQDVAGGVQALADAYRQSYNEQRRLVRLSDRMQLELQTANQRLAEQAAELQQLNFALAAEVEQRLQLTEELRKLVTTDVLTGVYTRRHLFEIAAQEISRHARSGTPLAVLILDLDHFKSINDRLGHAAGDQALKHFVAEAQAMLRNIDVLGRLGGEEFVILLPQTGVDGAWDVAERLRRGLSERPLAIGVDTVTVEVSIGLTVYRAEDDSFDRTLSRADHALYEAKRRGRNRTIIDPESTKEARR
jgi:diguanylate cyclase (GGDEF)-like protein